MPLTEDEQTFAKKYWHTNTQIVTVINPRKDDYVFQATTEVGVNLDTGRMKAETRTYRVPHGGQERFPGPIANMYLDQMSKLVAQDEDKIQFMVDWALKAQYYDQLIVSIEDLIHTYAPFPEYLDKPEQVASQPEEIPFAEVKRKPGRPPAVASEV